MSMLVVDGVYVISGSPGDEPELARVMLTIGASNTAIGMPYNLPEIDALEPDRVTGERPSAKGYVRMVRYGDQSGAWASPL